jgi:hypothetical protein
MGLLGNLKRNAKSGSLFDSLGAAQATLAGDYGGAASIYARGRAGRREEREDREKREREAAEIERARQTIDNWGKANPNVPRETVEALKLDPKALTEVIAHNLKIRQYGAAGGSENNPITGQTTMAPSRHEFQGSVFDVAGGPVGAPATVTPQHEGTQWVTPQPGAKAFGVNSFTGARRVGPPPSAPRLGESPSPPAAQGGTPVGATYTDPDDGKVYRKVKSGDDVDPGTWAPVAQGGAGPRGPRTFPGPY